MLQKIILNKSDLLKSIAKIFIILSFCMFILIAMLSIISVIICKTDFSYEILSPIIVCTLSFSSLISSFFVSRWFKENGIVYGAFVGFIICVFIILVTIFYRNFSLTASLLTKLTAVIVSGAIGGIIGVNIN